jgi:hypothetical protein
MPVRSVERFPDEPIILIVFEGLLTAEDIVESYERSAPLVTEGFNLFIVDGRETSGNFAEMMRILKTETEMMARIEREYPEQAASQSVMYFVGTDAFARFYVNSRRLERFGSEIVPMFPTLEAALAAARVQLHTLSTGEYRRIMGIGDGETGQA